MRVFFVDALGGKLTNIFQIQLKSLGLLKNKLLQTPAVSTDLKFDANNNVNFSSNSILNKMIKEN